MYMAGRMKNTYLEIVFYLALQNAVNNPFS